MKKKSLPFVIFVFATFSLNACKKSRVNKATGDYHGYEYSEFYGVSPDGDTSIIGYSETFTSVSVWTRDDSVFFINEQNGLPLNQVKYHENLEINNAGSNWEAKVVIYLRSGKLDMTYEYNDFYETHSYHSRVSFSGEKSN